MTILAAEAARPGRASLLLALAKPRLNALAVATVAIGYYLGAQEFDLAVFLAVVAGSALVAGGGAAFNQVAERDLDALMARTRSRPLPTGGGGLPVRPEQEDAVVAGAWNRCDRDRVVEGGQDAVVLHCQGQEVDVRDLAVASNRPGREVLAFTYR